MEASRRRHLVISVMLVLAGPAILTMADLHWRTGYDVWKTAQLVLFSILFGLIALGAAQSLIGFGLRRKGGDSCRIEDALGSEDEGPVSARTAIVMPICNEEVGRVFEGVRAIYESLERTGRLTECDFFLLSDSTDLNCWIGEEEAWLALARKLGAHGRIFYRRRRQGINKKAGNLADFCRRWGRLYRYMVVLDADSLMTGDAIMRLVQMMERNPRVGIIQGVPLLANGETVLARIQQFASRLYGPVSVTGLNYWQLGEANYWGHNAIIRLAPFIRHCSLPELPGDGPFGGRILSHDYVEAALMRRAGWEVWLATGTEGNFEECPPTVVDLVGRDRRWLQGNLQHARLIVARNINAVNRVHFILGILAFLSSPLWLAFLILSTVIASRTREGSGSPTVSGFAVYTHWSYAGEALCLFGYTIALLFLPKILAILDLRSRPAAAEAFGGWKKIMPGVLLETLTSTLMAPVLMLFHSWFIGLTLVGKKVSWGSQRRGGAGDSSWVDAVSAQAAQTVIGVLAAAVVIRIDPYMALWMSPILAGLILSIPLSYLLGSRSIGLSLRGRGIFQTPEEGSPIPEIAEIAAGAAARRRAPAPPAILAAQYGVLLAVLDPFVNAVHVSLLRSKEDQPPATEERFVALRATLLLHGPEALDDVGRKALLTDAESMHRLHHEVWSTPAAGLSEWWRSALEYYSRLAPAPKTALSR
jgi:membrane glycosyltransferase